ncbi:hypothetical protein KFE25_002711 [Diacronema lutheri]|uniref:Uncharacterized protein n=1 Tax=Diacronema lutheri TaxID=2081491 RepID=A0A8J5XLJ3_DIALT|nr:hypothetical protein KFE25_002711 [Diacronema lutheri]
MASDANLASAFAAMFIRGDAQHPLRGELMGALLSPASYADAARLAHATTNYSSHYHHAALFVPPAASGQWHASITPPGEPPHAPVGIGDWGRAEAWRQACAAAWASYAAQHAHQLRSSPACGRLPHDAAAKRAQPCKTDDAEPTVARARAAEAGESAPVPGGVTNGATAFVPGGVTDGARAPAAGAPPTTSAADVARVHQPGGALGTRAINDPTAAAERELARVSSPAAAWPPGALAGSPVEDLELEAFGPIAPANKAHVCADAIAPAPAQVGARVQAATEQPALAGSQLEKARASAIALLTRMAAESTAAASQDESNDAGGSQGVGGGEGRPAGPLAVPAAPAALRPQRTPKPIAEASVIVGSRVMVRARGEHYGQEGVVVALDGPDAIVRFGDGGDILHSVIEVLSRVDIVLVDL